MKLQSSRTERSLEGGAGGKRKKCVPSMECAGSSLICSALSLQPLNVLDPFGPPHFAVSADLLVP